MLVILLSIVLGVIPLLGITWTIREGTITTVDGLFLSLILVALSTIFFFNALMELRREARDSDPARKSS